MLVIRRLEQKPVEKQDFEIVERKGLGHPDNMCDLICNSISVALCREYIKKTGKILHHNIDKAMLAAGEAENKFGGGIIKKPMLLVLGDRATYHAGKIDIPVNEIAIKTAKKWFAENMRFVKEENVNYQIELKKVGAELAGIFKSKGILGANDTSAAVGYFPMTKTEHIVLETEKFLNSKKFKKSFPETGEDIKIMACREGKNLSLIIAMAFLDRFINSEREYFQSKEEVLKALGEFTSGFKGLRTNIDINTLDKKGKKEAGVYLSVTGTSAEGSDSGQVGRGNRPNGVISLNRYASEEAAAGKNPVSHVGKIYNVLCFRIAEEIYKATNAREVYVWLCSKIGQKINKPAIASIQILAGKDYARTEKKAKQIFDYEMQNIEDFCMKLAKGKIKVC